MEKSGKYVQNPINNKYIELMYRTGDLATVNDFGEIIFVGRKDFQIKRLGHRIELGEIENAILSVNEVEDACCAYNARTNEIIAVYTGKIDSNSLASSISQKLSSYMMPNRFVKLDTMPKNLNDKIDRVKIKKEYAED